MDDSDAVLVLAARRGDKEALGVLLGRHRSVLLALCRRTLGGALLAEDAAQEAALQAMLGLDALRQPARFGPWLCGIGLNICRRWLRARTWDDWSWEAMQGGYRMPEPVSWDAAPEEAAETSELVERVRRAVSMLPHGQRAAVMLFYLSGLTHAEIAAQLGVEIGAVKTRLHKARAALRRQLWADWKEEEMAAEDGEQMVPMRVSDIVRVPDGKAVGQHVVMLEEIDGPRRLHFWIGPHEGEALALTLEKVQAPRPMTYAFAASLLTATGGRMRAVRITKIVESTYYAEVTVEGPGGTRVVDARPSDALNLAVIVGASIYVDVSVIEEGTRVEAAFLRKKESPAPEGQASEEEIAAAARAEAVRAFIQNLASSEGQRGSAQIVAEITGGKPGTGR